MVAIYLCAPDSAILEEIVGKKEGIQNGILRSQSSSEWIVGHTEVILRLEVLGNGHFYVDVQESQ